MKICGDFHFHLNSSGGHRAKQKARRVLMNATHLDFVCSTEHAYKNPLEAYQHLLEASDGSNTTILPGVEAISREGIELIAIFSNIDDLRRSILIKPFSWSIFDHKRLSSDALTVLPHMFSPSKTGIVTTLGLSSARRIVVGFDYIESHNGAFYDLSHSGVGNYFPRKYRTAVQMTASIPHSEIPDEVGCSVGSDAHEPWGMNIYGVADVDAEFNSGNIFTVLKGKLKFKVSTSSQHDTSAIRGSSRALMSGITSLGEYVVKSRTRRAHVKA